jgi:hypothetical protein
MSGLAWFSYMADGAAYGSIKSLAGRERDLAQFGVQASRALAAAASFEAIAVGLGAWYLLPQREPTWTRLSFALALAAVTDILTFVVIQDL